MVAQISSLLATLLFENQQYIKGNIVFMQKNTLRPTFEYSWGGGFKGMFLPLVSRSVDPVYFNISPLYQIISSHQFHQLSYYIPHLKRELCERHVRDPESTRLRKKTFPELHIERIDLQFLNNKLQILYYQQMQKI